METNCEVVENICINKTTNRQIKACVPMHTFGHPCRIEEIKDICDIWNITLVEDAAESLGSFIKTETYWNFWKNWAFSFNGNKIITSGGGGVIVTDDESLAKEQNISQQLQKFLILMSMYMMKPPIIIDFQI